MVMVATSTCNGDRDRDTFQYKTYVTIFNFIGEEIDLTLHCKSGDDDLGEQVIPYNKAWYFAFSTNIWGTTLFYCSFKWENEETKWFDIYDFERDAEVCGLVCWWYIYPTRVCLEYKGLTCYPWPPNSYPFSLGPSFM